MSTQRLTTAQALVLARFARLPVDSSTVLGAFGRRWLLNHVPRAVERTVLLQGDTGPGNFMFENHRVTAVVYWE